ncbi:hypothetical protein CsSME_00051037 [Camellia sinensis var. sinensis]
MIGFQSIGSFFHEKSITLGSLLGLILFKRHYRLKSMEATAECTLPPLVCCVKEAFPMFSILLVNLTPKI